MGRFSPPFRITLLTGTVLGLLGPTASEATLKKYEQVLYKLQ